MNYSVACVKLSRAKKKLLELENQCCKKLAFKPFQICGFVCIDSFHS